MICHQQRKKHLANNKDSEEFRLSRMPRLTNIFVIERDSGSSYMSNDYYFAHNILLRHVC